MFHYVLNNFPALELWFLGFLGFGLRTWLTLHSMHFNLTRPNTIFKPIGTWIWWNSSTSRLVGGRANFELRQPPYPREPTTLIMRWILTNYPSIIILGKKEKKNLKWLQPSQKISKLLNFSLQRFPSLLYDFWGASCFQVWVQYLIDSAQLEF